MQLMPTVTDNIQSKRLDDRVGTQIDLLISRADNVINMCEIKFYGGDFWSEGTTTGSFSVGKNCWRR